MSTARWCSYGHSRNPANIRIRNGVNICGPCLDRDRVVVLFERDVKPGPRLDLGAPLPRGDVSWMSQSLCSGLDPSLFDDSGESEICGQCPVLVQCRADRALTEALTAIVCKNGHRQTDDRVYVDREGYRQCRDCHKERQARYTREGLSRDRVS